MRNLLLFQIYVTPLSTGSSQTFRAGSGLCSPPRIGSVTTPLFSSKSALTQLHSLLSTCFIGLSSVFCLSSFALRTCLGLRMDHLQPFTFGSPRHTHSGQCFLVLIYLILAGEHGLTEPRILLALFWVFFLCFEVIFASISSDIALCFLFVYRFPHQSAALELHQRDPPRLSRAWTEVPD